MCDIRRISIMPHILRLAKSLDCVGALQNLLNFLPVVAFVEFCLWVYDFCRSEHSRFQMKLYKYTYFYQKRDEMQCPLETPKVASKM